MGLNSNSIFKHIEVLHAIYGPVDSFFTIHQSEIKHSIVVKTSTATDSPCFVADSDKNLQDEGNQGNKGGCTSRGTRRARFIICCSCLFFRGRKFTVGRAAR